MLGYVLDEVFAGHRAPAGHPERPARAIAVRDALVAAGVRERGTLVAPRLATDAELAAVHRGSYLDDLTRTLPGQSGWLDADTYFAPDSWDAAQRAAGAVSQLALDVLAGRFQRGLAVVRPPGHHACADRAMGFCILNNVAVAARAARAAGAARVAILDWDVHHGNGTQDIFWDDPSVMYLSVHQFPFYPGSGAPTEIGGPAARGATVNVGLPAGAGDADYLAAVDDVLVPALRGFAPDIILVSAGFDAFAADPIAGMQVTHAGFAAMARRVVAAANAACAGRLVVSLEGGYDLGGVAGGMTEVLHALVDEAGAAIAAPDAPPTPDRRRLTTDVRAAIAATTAALAATRGDAA